MVNCQQTKPTVVVEAEYPGDYQEEQSSSCSSCAFPDPLTPGRWSNAPSWDLPPEEDVDGLT